MHLNNHYNDNRSNTNIQTRDKDNENELTQVER